MVLLTRLYPAPFLNGTLKKSSYGSQTTDYTYNLANMLTEVNNANDSTQISKYTYTYYVDGNQKSKTESVAGTNKGTTNYTYDGLNRLVRENIQLIRNLFIRKRCQSFKYEVDILLKESTTTSI